MLRKLQYNLAKMLNFPINPETDRRVQNMKKAIERVGGHLNFSVKRHHNGWTAECQEMNGIITGGNTANPTDQEINDEIRDAIFSAFGVPPYLCKDELLRDMREIPIVENRVFA